MRKLILALFAFFMIVSCSGKKDTILLTVASKQADCMGVAPQKCLLIKSKEDPDWTFFYSNIEGFNYVPGYEYVLEVKKEKIDNPPADRSAFVYKLVKEVSKTAKESTDLPPSVQ